MAIYVYRMSGNQTWLAGKSQIEVNDFPRYEPLFSSEISQPPMCEDAFVALVSNKVSQ